MLPFGLNCRLQLAGVKKKRQEGVKPTCFMLIATNHSQYSSLVEALNLIIESKSLPEH